MNSTPAPTPVAEWHDVTPALFSERILPAGEPALLRGLVSAWPAVRAGRESPAAVANYLRAFGSGPPVDTMVADAAIGGYFFYDDTLSGHNFERRQQTLGDSLAQLLAVLEDPAPPSLYVGAMPSRFGLPGFDVVNRLPLPLPGEGGSGMQRLWIGNRVTVQTHYDLSHNVACVVAGRRRFTLFPPEQLENLYVGPLEFTLAGQPISMVRLDAPDFERYPRFRDALAAARVAELEPGDALFIPTMWWHHVESRDRFNILANYWWDDVPPWLGSPFDAMLHALMSVRSLPPERREIWHRMFEHYVFEAGGDPAAHLPPARRGVLGTPSLHLAQALRAHLARAFTPRRP